MQGTTKAIECEGCGHVRPCVEFCDERDDGYYWLCVDRCLALWRAAVKGAANTTSNREG